MNKDYERLKLRVKVMLKNVDLIRAYIEGHEFDLAGIYARGLDRDCTDVNQLANRLADAESAVCACKDRDQSACPGEWEPGCDFGNNPAHVRVANTGGQNGSG